MLILSVLGALATEATSASPNIVVIFADDLGYNDLGCFGSSKIQTPHLDQMAREGRRLTSFLVPCSVCTPSRAALLTGCYPKRVDLHKHVLFPQSRRGLNPDEYTLADHLKSAGYATACIGKWHLGHYPETLPRAHGFDSYFGIPYSNDMNHPDNKGKPRMPRDKAWQNMEQSVVEWHTPLVQDEQIVELPVDQRTITRRYTDRAIEFVTENKDRPFFLYLPHSMPHIPLFVPQDVYDPDPQNAYTCTIEHIDAEVGRLMDTIRSLGLSKNTIVVFTSDNGPWLQFKNHGGSALPLRSGKGTPFEGGQRVPCIVWAPGRVPANTESDAFTSTMDLLPTFAAWIGRPLPDERKIDGLNILPCLTGDTASPRNEMVYYTANGRLTGIRQGDWKLLIDPARRRPRKGNAQTTEPAKTFLFDLANDVSESTNLAQSNPDRVAELTALMKQRDAEIIANQRTAWETTEPHPWP